MSEPALQPVHITIKQFGVADGTERHVELTVAADRTLNELFAAIGPEHRSARGLTWRFQIGERAFDWAAPIVVIRAEYANTRHIQDGVLWLELYYFADRPVGNDFVFRTPGATPSYGPRSSDSNLPTLPELNLPGAPGSAVPPLPPPPTPPRAAGRAPAALPPPVSVPAPEAEDEEGDYEDDEAEAPRPKPSKSKPDATLYGMSGRSPRRQTDRRATVRYYTRMNPDRMFPLLVILSAEEVQKVVKARVGQASSESFKVEEGSVVEVEPVLPGCDCYPPRLPLIVAADGTSTGTVWVVPKVLGKVQGARVLIRQGNRTLAEVPLEITVAKQTLAVACGLLSLASPYITSGLKSAQLDYASQKATGFPLYYRLLGWLADLGPAWIALGFLGLAAGLYVLMRPRRRDVFWDVNTK